MPVPAKLWDCNCFIEVQEFQEFRQHLEGVVLKSSAKLPSELLNS